MTRAVVVHSLEQARAALAAAAELGVPVDLVSGGAAAGFAGPLWFLEMIEAARADYPQVKVTAIFDCGEAPGYALAALRAGCRAIRFKGRPSVEAKIVAIAKRSGARLVGGRLRALDLLNERDPAAACRKWLRAHKGAAT